MRGAQLKAVVSSDHLTLGDGDTTAPNFASLTRSP